LVDGIQGVQDVLAFGQADTQQRQVAALDLQLARVQRSMAVMSGLHQALTDLLANLALWTILLLATPLVASGAISGVYLGFLAVLILASFELIQPLGPAFQFLGNSLTAGKRIFELTDAQPAITEPAHPLPVPAGHTLAFEHVSFAYAAGENDVLHDITLSLSPGQRVALVGKSGSGKTTLGRLALRLWEPTQGLVRLDGHDLRNYLSQQVRDCISIVDQETYLFNDTLRANLLLGKPSASPAEIERALDLAQLSDLVRQLPKGVDTWIGEQGLRLSGGERQRVAVARALLKDAPLLILDEATANLDPATEEALLQSLERLMRGRATLVITHRLLAMEQMDEIIVLDYGQIRERGTHAQLLARGDLYCQLLAAQNNVLAFP
jgi:ATP-binding cassette subfamily C protein CydC